MPETTPCRCELSCELSIGMSFNLFASVRTSSVFRRSLAHRASYLGGLWRVWYNYEDCHKKEQVRERVGVHVCLLIFVFISAYITYASVIEAFNTGK
jgi:hypothetical protein